MPRVAILIAASPTPAFYSQLAVLSLAVRKLTRSRWQPQIHVYLGGQRDDEANKTWFPHLRDVEFTWVSDVRFARDGDWAQSDDVFRFAPRDVDAFIAMDADTLPIAPLEEVLDRVVDTNSVAGVIAHYPTVLGDARFPATSLRAAWQRLAQGLIEAPLNFAFSHTLMAPDTPTEHRLTPFYLNFGVVFFPKAAFENVACRYLAIRPNLMDRMVDPDFSGQAALTLAVTAAGAATWALPMRYNFPNDPIAAGMYPEELAKVAIFHYLRTGTFDRHRIFTSREQYDRFLALPLTGVDRLFQESTRTIVGADYPFA